MSMKIQAVGVGQSIILANLYGNVDIRLKSFRSAIAIILIKQYINSSIHKQTLFDIPFRVISNSIQEQNSSSFHSSLLIHSYLQQRTPSENQTSIKLVLQFFCVKHCQFCTFQKKFCSTPGRHRSQIYIHFQSRLPPTFLSV